MLTVPMMGNPDPEAEVKEDQTVYEGLVNRELPIITYLDDPPLGEGLACNETEQRPSTSDASSGFRPRLRQVKLLFSSRAVHQNYPAEKKSPRGAGKNCRIQSLTHPLRL